MSFNCADEEIDGYFVSSKMKRIWAAELNMLKLFDALCRKHGLRYYACYGTLLGAVRHKGFIPWCGAFQKSGTAEPLP